MASNQSRKQSKTQPKKRAGLAAEDFVSVEIATPDSKLQTFYHPEKRKHYVTCDLCDRSVDAGNDGHGTRILDHRDGRDCKRDRKALGRPEVRIVLTARYFVFTIPLVQTVRTGSAGCSAASLVCSPLSWSPVQVASGLILGALPLP